MEKFKHTKGKWSVAGGDEAIVFNDVSDDPCRNFTIAKCDNSGINKEEAFYNAKLISASPEGLQVSIKTYVAMLHAPHDSWRILNQDIYCSLRDYIARATGTEIKEIQEFYERVALYMKYNNLSFEQAIKKATE
jgi:hypothetical protein